MARSTIALALLGLLACAAVAQAENAETQKRHHGDYDKRGHGDNDKHHHEEEHHEENHKRVLTYNVANAKFDNLGGLVVGASGVLNFDLQDSDGNKVATGRLTGIATEVSLAAPVGFILNADLSIVVTEGKYKGTILTASGPIQWDNTNKIIVKPLDTMVFTGATGALQGADGTVVLSATPTPTLTFNLRLREVEGKHGKDY